jgi:hypothetical protein
MHLSSSEEVAEAALALVAPPHLLRTLEVEWAR